MSKLYLTFFKCEIIVFVCIECKCKSETWNCHALGFNPYSLILSLAVYPSKVLGWEATGAEYKATTCCPYCRNVGICPINKQFSGWPSRKAGFKHITCFMQGPSDSILANRAVETLQNLRQARIFPSAHEPFNWRYHWYSCPHKNMHIYHQANNVFHIQCKSLG